jgi:hypothetical protein
MSKYQLALAFVLGSALTALLVLRWPSGVGEEVEFKKL